MEIDFNWWAILAGAGASMLSGMIWYSPKAFGNVWMKAAGMTQKQMESGSVLGMIVATIRSFIISLALFSIIYVTDAFYADSSFLENAIGVGAWIGIAVVGLTIFMHDAFEQRNHVITRVNVGYEVVTIMLVSVAIGLVAG